MLTRYRFLLAVLIFPCLLAIALVVTRPAGKERIYLVILAGQSNAVGWGSVFEGNHALPDHDYGPSLLWYLQGNPGKPVHGNGWQLLAPQRVHGKLLLGPEAGLAETLGEALKAKIGIIKIAFNGSPLKQGPGLDWHPRSPGELFQVLTGEVAKAIDELPSGFEPVLYGMCWIQGESDAMSATRSAEDEPSEAESQYADDLQEFLAAFRRSVQAAELNVAIALISTPPVDKKGRAFALAGQTRRAQREAGRLPNNRVFETNDLAKTTDDLHFGIEGTNILGARCAESLLSLSGVMTKVAAPRQ